MVSDKPKDEKATKQEFIDFVEPYVKLLPEFNSPRSAEIILNAYNDWAHPLTLEQVTADLTEDQKLVAAKILHAYFSDPA